MRFLGFVLLIVFAFGGNAVAKITDLTLIVSAPESGNYNFMTQKYARALRDQGVNANVEISGNCAKGVQRFKDATDPVFMLFDVSFNVPSSPDYAACRYDYTEGNIVGIAWVSPFWFCGRKDEHILEDYLDKSKEYRIGVSGPIVAQWVKEVDRAFGLRNKIIAYETTGKLMQGMIGKDVDFLWSSQRAWEGVRDGTLDCYMTTGQDYPIGVQPLVTRVPAEFRRPNLALYEIMLAKNVDIKGARRLFEEINKAPDIADYLKATKLERPPVADGQLLEQAKTYERMWR